MEMRIDPPHTIKLRVEAMYLYFNKSTKKRTSEQVIDLMSDFNIEPNSVEWINNCSCAIIWPCAEDCWNALDKCGKKLSSEEEEAFLGNTMAITRVIPDS